MTRTERYSFECARCPRLAAALAADRLQNPHHVALPIGARGPRAARLLIVGLAPGHKGANRTGLVFAGDSSGQVLFRALHRFNLADSADPFRARLLNTRLTNCVKCWPPGNRPETGERNACRRYLEQELAELWRPGVRRPRVLLCLGRFAHEAVRRLDSLPGKDRWPEFGHNQGAWLTDTLYLQSAFHPSRQNMNTGRLTQELFDAAVERAARLCL
ncbi:MAG: uracil-DNA glycosylase family protein [Pseudomonadota bacterium]